MIRTILLVDHEATYRREMESLTSMRHRVLLVGSEQEAHDRLSRERIDLLLLGIRSEEFEDGLRRLRTLRELAADTPVVILAAGGSVE